MAMLAHYPSLILEKKHYLMEDKTRVPATKRLFARVPEREREKIYAERNAPNYALTCNMGKKYGGT